jgi:hypothetical protein
MRVRNDAWLPLGNRNGACLPRPGAHPEWGMPDRRHAGQGGRMGCLLVVFAGLFRRFGQPQWPYDHRGRHRYADICVQRGL